MDWAEAWLIDAGLELFIDQSSSAPAQTAPIVW